MAKVYRPTPKPAMILSYVSRNATVELARRIGYFAIHYDVD
jgi:hypothetical protein